jgi:hypothetical protein
LRSATTILDGITYTAGKDAGPGSGTGAAGPVLLRPGEVAEAFLWWTNLCSPTRPAVTTLLVTLPEGGTPLVARPEGTGSFIGTPRCDQPTKGTTFTAYAFVPTPSVASLEQANGPQPAMVDLSVPGSTMAGSTLAFLVGLTNLGTTPALLTPCPSYTEDLIVGGNALKPPAPQQFLLNCSAIGDALAPGTPEVTMSMQYAVPATVAPGPVQVVWSMDPGGPFDASTAIGRAWFTVTGR